MSDDVKNMISHLKRNGVTRLNRFRVTIPLPAGIQDITNPTPQSDDEVNNWIRTGIRIVKAATHGDVTAARSLQILCSDIQVPGVNINTTVANDTGHKIKIASGADFSDVNLSFMLGRDMAEKKTLDNWQSLIFDERTTKVGYFQDYTVDIEVEILDEFDRVVYRFVMQDSNPILFNSLNFSKSELDSFLRYDVGFSFARIVYGEQAVETVNPFRNFQPLQIVEDIRQGDLAGAVAKAREVIVRAKEGELTSQLGRDIHKMISDIALNTDGFENITGTLGVGGIQESVGGIVNPSAINSVLAATKVDVIRNDGLNNADRNTLTNMITDLMNA